MLLLGHLGIGPRIVRPFTRGLPRWPVYLGAITPDLIDKPAYFLASWATGRHGADVGVLSGTRTFGHTLLLTGLVAIVGRWRGSGVVIALALGMLSHLALDSLADALGALQGPPAPGTIPGVVAILWPVLGWQFPFATAPNATSYFALTMTLWNLAGEILGALFLILDARAFARARDVKPAVPHPSSG
jgi:hypothetical protein